METLETEYGDSFTTEGLDAALEAEEKLCLACDQEEKNYHAIEKKLDLCRQLERKSYQEMLSAFRTKSDLSSSSSSRIRLN